MYDTVLERRAVEQRGRHNMQVVEPAADLTGVLNDEIAREVGLEPVLVLERIVLLCKRHAAGLKPAVEHLRDAVHGRAALAREGNLIDKLSVQVIEALAASLLDLIEGAENNALAALRTLPDRDRGRPVAVSGDVPVTGIFEPLAEAGILDGIRDPVDLLIVQLDEARLQLLDIEIPCVHCLIDERLAAAPAVRIVMLDRAVRDSLAVVVEETDDRRVHLNDGLCVGIGVEVGDLLREVTLLIDRVDHRDLVVAAGPVVVLTECRCGMDDADALLGADIVSSHDAERALCGLIGKVREQRLVGLSDEVCALALLQNDRLLAENLGEVGKCCLTRDKDLALDLNECIVKLFADCKAEVGRQRPRGRRPCKEIDLLAVDHVVGPELGDDPSVLTRTGGVRFSGIGDRQGCFTAAAVRGDAVVAVDEPLVIALLECPHDGLHIGEVHGLVGAVVIDPARHLIDVFAPCFVILGNDLVAGVIELADADRTLDLGFAVDAECLFGLCLDRQAVAVPAPDTRHGIALHGVVACDQILDKGNEHGAVVRNTGRERRAVVEHDLLCLSVVNGAFKDIFCLPAFQHILLDLSELRAAVERLITVHP